MLIFFPIFYTFHHYRLLKLGIIFIRENWNILFKTKKDILMALPEIFLERQTQFEVFLSSLGIMFPIV